MRDINMSSALCTRVNLQHVKYKIKLVKASFKRRKTTSDYITVVE